MKKTKIYPLTYNKVIKKFDSKGVIIGNVAKPEHDNDVLTLCCFKESAKRYTNFLQRLTEKVVDNDNRLNTLMSSPPYNENFQNNLQRLENEFEAFKSEMNSRMTLLEDTAQILNGNIASYSNDSKMLENKINVFIHETNEKLYKN